METVRIRVEVRAPGMPPRCYVLKRRLLRAGKKSSVVFVWFAGGLYLVEYDGGLYPYIDVPAATIDGNPHRRHRLDVPGQYE